MSDVLCLHSQAFHHSCSKLAYYTAMQTQDVKATHGPNGAVSTFLPSKRKSRWLLYHVGIPAESGMHGAQDRNRCSGESVRCAARFPALLSLGNRSAFTALSFPSGYSVLIILIQQKLYCSHQFTEQRQQMYLPTCVHFTKKLLKCPIEPNRSGANTDYIKRSFILGVWL